MINTTAIARALKANLAAHSIRIKHVQALDLIAAGIGLANRHVLAATPGLKPIQRVHIQLLTSAATALAIHDTARRQVIIDQTSSILRTEATSNEMIDLDTHDLCVTVAELDDPETFLKTERGTAFVKSIVSDLYYQRYERYQNDGPMGHKEANSLAQAILEAKRQGESAHQAIASEFEFGYSPIRYWYDQGQSEVEAVMDKIVDELDDLEQELSLEKWDWIHALETPILDQLENDDTSKPEDLLGSYDKCEVVFLFKAPGYALDEMISSTKAWSEFGHMHVDHSLQHGLACLGYSVGDYRKLSGNRLESDNLRPGVKKRADRLIPPDQLEEIIDNASAQYFLFALYAIIPVQELINLDLAKPITFSTTAVASYNPFCGTFHEVRINRPVTVTPKEGELRSGSEGISPDEICGLYRPVFYASLANETASISTTRKLDVAA